MPQITKRIDAAMPRATERTCLAQQAYKQRDVANMAALHCPQQIVEMARQSQADTSPWFGKYLGSMVYGGLDGIITTFAVVSGVAGAQLGTQVILILGIGNLLADGFSMGTGNYISKKSEREYYGQEARRQNWEIKNCPEGQQAELHALYVQHGYSADEANQMVYLQTRRKNRWVNAMMIEEMHMLEDDTNPLYNSIATFISFVIAGSLPLMIYLIGLVTPIAPNVAFTISIILSALALFGLGAAKFFVTRLSPIRSGLEMLLVGGFAALVAYSIGALLKNIGG